MNRPWMKFYPTDWRADPALRMCSLGARGLWAEMMCIMHEAEPYGTLLIKGQPVTDRQLALLSGASPAQVQKLLAELEGAGVFSRDESGTIYSRRMRRDQQKAERDRENGAAGGNPSLKGGVNPPDKAQRPEARSQNPKKEKVIPAAEPPTDDDFEEFWKAYPRRKGGNSKHSAKVLFLSAVKSGVDGKRIVEAVRAGAGYDRDKIGTEFIPQAVKWLRDKRWEEYLDGTEANEARIAQSEEFLKSRGYVRGPGGRWVKPEEAA